MSDDVVGQWGWGEAGSLPLGAPPLSRQSRAPLRAGTRAGAAQLRPITTVATMQYVYLGGTGLKVSNLCLGTMTFGGPADGRNCDEATSHAILDAYAAAGGNFIDTADIYNGGESEAIIGRCVPPHPRAIDVAWICARAAAMADRRWLAKRSDRHRMVVATKVRFSADPKAGPNDVGLSRSHIFWAVEESLKRLQVRGQLQLRRLRCRRLPLAAAAAAAAHRRPATSICTSATLGTRARR